MEQNKSLISSASHILSSSLRYEAPLPFGRDSDYTKIYRRVIEIQVEQCDAIYSLYNNGLYRPAYAVLRSVLETMSTLVWLSLNIEKYFPLFETATQPNQREILRRIGWEDEYDRTFRYLSGFVHIDIDNAEFYREYEWEPDGSQPFPEINADADYYFTLQKNPQLLMINPMSHEAANQRYGPYIEAKTFDLIAAGLQKLYGAEYYRRLWWHPESGLAFMKFIADHFELKQKMLWSIQPNLL